MRGRAWVVIVATMTTVGLLAGCDSGGSDVTLTQMQARSEQIGEDLVAQAADVTDTSVTTASAASEVRSDEDDAPSDTSGRRYWQWSKQIVLRDTADPETVARDLGNHLAHDGWTVGSPSVQTPTSLPVRRSDDLGPDWYVELTWSGPTDGDASLVRSVMILVVSPTTSKD